MKDERVKSDVDSGKNEIEIISEGQGVDEACPDINATLCCGSTFFAFL